VWQVAAPELARIAAGSNSGDPEVRRQLAGLFKRRGVYQALNKAGARPGDRLLLTKPLGTGMISFAAQIGRAPPGASKAAAASMAQLNRRASELMIDCGAHACTDVTGFGLIGHLAEMAASSGVDVEVVWDDVPLLPGVLECAAAGILPGGVERNRESSADAVTLRPGAEGPEQGRREEPIMLDVLLDPQTSGGLLVAGIAGLLAAGATVALPLPLSRPAFSWAPRLTAFM
jgi:selenide,water dikinase